MPEESFKDKVKAVVKETLEESVFSKYIECDGCGNLILKKYGHCAKCNMTYTDGKWIKDNPEPEFVPKKADSNDDDW